MKIAQSAKFSTGGGYHYVDLVMLPKRNIPVAVIR